MQGKRWFIAIAALVVLAGCDKMWGTIDDPTVDEIFEEGRIDPTAVPQTIGYVPILPFWEGFEDLQDIFIGYDEMVYVVDKKGVHVLDLTGKEHRLIPFTDATDVTQDRRLHLYVAARIAYSVNDSETYSLPAIFRLSHTAGAGSVVWEDTLIHPFADPSRRLIGVRASDTAARFTGLACRADNVLYALRQGPINNLASTAWPDNAVLFFSAEGENTGYAFGLNPIFPDLKSVVNATAIAGFAAPPQRIYGIPETHDFLITQATQPPAEFATLWIREVVDPNVGVSYEENASLLQKDYSKGRRFLYDPFRFSAPADVCVAGDKTGYIFVVDRDRDSVYQFTQKGIEGVPPLPAMNETRHIIVSFGGHGAGPFQFDQPVGVAYYDKTLYVADRGNRRIARFRLNTDIE